MQMRHPKEGYPWAPFREFGGLPWSSENAEESFDKVELVGDTEVDGQPAIHYRASRMSAPEHESDLHPIVSYWRGKRRVETVHRGVEDYLRTIDNVDLWVTQDGGRLIKADWMHIERGPSLPADYKERDWCEGLGEFSEPEYTFRVTDSQGNRSYFIGHSGMSRDTHDLAEVICWNEEETEGRQVWGRNIPEHTGEDFWVRWVYTFTGFNEPSTSPTTCLNRQPPRSPSRLPMRGAERLLTISVRQDRQSCFYPPAIGSEPLSPLRFPPRRFSLAHFSAAPNLNRPES